MTKRRLPASAKHPLGTFGLLLMLLVAKLAEHSHPLHPPYSHRAQAFLAKRAIDGVAVIGWLADRLGDRTRSAIVAGRDTSTRPMSRFSQGTPH